VEGIAGLELDRNKWKLDGYNVWPVITQTPCKEVPINLNPPSEGFVGADGRLETNYRLAQMQFTWARTHL